MPYIPADKRAGAEIAPTNVGELTYKLTLAVDEYLGLKPRFSDFAAVLGALEATKLELYRRVIAPYEDQKILAHGDVYASRD